MPGSLRNYLRTEFTEYTAHIQREKVKQQHTDMEITLLICFQIPLHSIILCRQRTNKLLRESNIANELSIPFTYTVLNIMV